ncbi:rhamnulokinase [uncultured Paludibacter sp.]|nr:rhamnulokinase [uncultured Paludibacter sp.]
MSRDKLSSFLAIDLGASSGRSILGIIQNRRLELKEINRFSNPIVEINGRSYWDLFHLYCEILISLKKTKEYNVKLLSLGIDTWGVDYVCFGKDGEVLRMPYSYRDSNTFGAPEKFFKKMPKQEVYKKTGIQIMNFNSLFQLATQLEEKNSVYPIIDKILFIPDALSYLLTGKMVTEYTIASTSQMIDPSTKKFDKTLLKELKLQEDNFAPLVFSGTKIGTLSESVKHQTGCDDISVVAVAGHDTASAVLAVPAENEKFAYLSSGTWSLMGIESEKPVITDETFALNFTNEGGADGSIRLLKNICGMWLIEQCKKEWEKNKPVSYNEIVQYAQKVEPFRCFINPDSPCFTHPQSMINSIQTYCKETNQYIPQTIGEISRCIYESLAFRYKQVLENLQKLATFQIEKLYIIGGGAQNNMLNSFTANAIGKTVIAGPVEATAIGNILVQAQAAGFLGNKSDMREIVRNSINLSTFEPEDTTKWETNYGNYLNVYKEI